MKKLKRLIVLMLALVISLGLAGCNKSNNNLDSSEDDTVTDEVTESKSQEVSKNSLGIHMSLSGEFADCTVPDLSESSLSSINEEAIGGFSIIKNIDGTDYTISNVLVLPNSEIETPEQRSQYPYIFSGGNYSIVGILPLLDTTDTDYDTVSQLQQGIIQQLCTIYFDESALTASSDNNEVNVDNTEDITDITNENEETTTEDNSSDESMNNTVNDTETDSNS